MDAYLVRHAEDRAAGEGRFGDESLTRTGLEQARRLADALAGVEFRSCLSSPLKRAVETAELLVKGRELAIELDANLSEGSVGELSGLSHEEAARRYPDDFRVGRTVVARLAAASRTAPGGESRSAFLSRARAAASRLERELTLDAGPVLVVSHGGILNYVLQLMLQIPVRDQVPFGFDHAGVVRIRGYREAPSFGPFSMLRFSAMGVE